MTNTMTMTVDMDRTATKGGAPMLQLTPAYAMLMALDHMTALRAEALDERLAASLPRSGGTLRARLGRSLIALGRRVSPETATAPRLGEPAPFPRSPRSDDRLDLGRAA